MRFDIITIFPKALDSYLNESMLKRAQAKKLVDIRVHDLRKFTRDEHKKARPTGRWSYGRVDDRPYGGGPGMVLRIDSIARAIESILKSKVPALPAGRKSQKSKVKIILFSAAGKQFEAKVAGDWAKKYDRLVMIAGRYEGVDERVKRIFKVEEISVGPYVLSGGELPAMVVTEAVARHIPGFLGKAESLEEKRHGIGVSMYTRPEVFAWRGKKYRVPQVLLSGDHKKIDAWRKRRPKVS